MTKNLINQPSKMPTRKLVAFMIATFVIEGAVGLGELALPGVGALVPAQNLIETLAAFLVAYFVKDRAV